VSDESKKGWPITEKDLVELLRNRLTINIEEKCRSYAEGRRIVVKLRLDEDVISEDSFDLKD
jgi:hypothetical protein